MGRRTQTPVPQQLSRPLRPGWGCLPHHFCGLPGSWEEVTRLLNNDSTTLASPLCMCLSVCLVCICVCAGVCFPRIEGHQYHTQTLCLGCIAFNLMTPFSGSWDGQRLRPPVTSHGGGQRAVVHRDPLRTPPPALCVSGGTAPLPPMCTLVKSKADPEELQPPPARLAGP